MSDLTSRTLADWQRAAARTVPDGRAWVDGGPVDAASGATFASRSPRDGALLARVARGDGPDVDAAVAAARRAFADGRWASRSPRSRRAVLLRWAELVRENTERLALLESLDMGKPVREAVRVDVPALAGTITWYAEALDKLYDEVAPSGPRALVTVTREPLGVIGAVVPWNYPLIIAGWKLAPALAAGNSVVLKPAEQSSLSALLLARLATEAGLPDGVLNVVPGLGPEAGEALGRHPDVDAVAFTGSEQVGRAFQRYAGESNGKKVAVEAGGKSPQLVLADAADLQAVATAVGWGICYNAGQTCNAGSRLVVDTRVRDALLPEVARVMAGFRVGDPLDPSTTMGALVDTAQLERVLGHLDGARGDGAHVDGGERLHAGSGGTYLSPATVTGAAPGSRIVQEEVFGPVLTVQEFDGVDAGVALANATRFGLAASVWTRDVTTAHRVARALRAGTVWVNTFDATDVFAPFGGFGASGTGRDKSLHALHEYTGLKTTWVDLS